MTAEQPDVTSDETEDDESWIVVPASYRVYAKTDEEWGDDFARIGMVEAAREAYEQSLRVDPSNPDIVAKIEALSEAPRGTAGIAQIASMRGFHEAYQYARAATAVGRYQLAIAVLKVALELNPEDVQALCSLGVAYRKAGDYDSALDALARADINAGGQDVFIDTARAATFRAAGRHDEAIRIYEHLLQHEPENPYALNGLGGVLMDLRRYSDAEQCFAKAKLTAGGEEGGIRGLMNLRERYRAEGDQSGVARIDSYFDSLGHPDPWLEGEEVPF